MSDPDPATQRTLAGAALDAVPAEDAWEDDHKCAWSDDGDDCRRWAVIGVDLQGAHGPGMSRYVPVCDRHAMGAWLHSAGVADGGGATDAA